MAKPQYGPIHRRIRAALLASMTWLNAPCPRCGLPMTWDQRKHLDLDHETDALGRRTGRYNGLAHRVCNRKDGGTVAYARREARVAAGRSPAERADHDHHVAVRMRREAKLARAAMEQEKVGRPW